MAIAGSVGNFLGVNNMDILFVQSAIFSPSDFPFPANAIVWEATSNAKMMLITDVNLDLLKKLHINRSVKNLKDKRTDLYSLTWQGKSWSFVWSDYLQ